MFWKFYHADFEFSEEYIKSGLTQIHLQSCSFNVPKTLIFVKANKRALLFGLIYLMGTPC